MLTLIINNESGKDHDAAVIGKYIGVEVAENLRLEVIM